MCILEFETFAEKRETRSPQIMECDKGCFSSWRWRGQAQCSATKIKLEPMVVLFIQAAHFNYHPPSSPPSSPSPSLTPLTRSPLQISSQFLRFYCHHHNLQHFFIFCQHQTFFIWNLRSSFFLSFWFYFILLPVGIPSLPVWVLIEIGANYHFYVGS